MFKFKEHLLESLKAESGKNVHLEHLEDEILNSGYAGFEKAMASVRGVIDVLSVDSPSSHEITTKWDGAPAIICGLDPSTGKFFVGTKSVFNVTPKLNFTDKDIDANHPAEGLNSKLKLALKHFKKLGIKEVLQGDLLFDSSTLVKEKIDGKNYLTFRANTITYAVDPDSKLGKRMSAAKVGIVFHTAYEGDSLQTMTARFNPDISHLKNVRDVWFDNATLRFAEGTGFFDDMEKKGIKKNIADLSATAKELRKPLNDISKNEGVKISIKAYINDLVRQNKSSGHADVNHLLAVMHEKAQKARKKPSNEETPSMKWIKANRNAINRVFSLHSKITELKMKIVQKLSSIGGEIGTFVKDGNGYRVTSPEGYVAIDRMSNKAIKLVDRLDFSRSNFNVSKDWKK